MYQAQKLSDKPSTWSELWPSIHLANLVLIAMPTYNRYSEYVKFDSISPNGFLQEYVCKLLMHWITDNQLPQLQWQLLIYVN